MVDRVKVFIRSSRVESIAKTNKSVARDTRIFSAGQLPYILRSYSLHIGLLDC
jgi:hypothetical protein